MMSVIMDVAQEYQKWDLVMMEIYVPLMICVIMDIAWEHLWFAIQLQSI
jgi:cytochrome c oxidase subunit IV